MSSGGSNIKNFSVAGFKNIDSFALNKTCQTESGVVLCINNMTHTLSLSKVPNNYGGRSRIYFICPRCGSRVRLLYIAGKYLFCRHCVKLSYPSQRCGRKTGTFHRLVSLFKQLNAVNTYDYMLTRLPDRPVNMPFKTYLRIIGCIEALQKKQWKYFSAKLTDIENRTALRDFLASSPKHLNKNPEQ